jgi:hypothetical protein
LLGTRNIMPHSGHFEPVPGMRADVLGRVRQL